MPIINRNIGPNLWKNVILKQLAFKWVTSSYQGNYNRASLGSIDRLWVVRSWNGNCSFQMVGSDAFGTLTLHLL